MRYLQKLLDRPDFYFVYLPQRTKTVYVDIYVKTGRLHETDEMMGIGHLMDHYINGSLYARYLDRLNTNAWISQEHLQFHLTSDDRKIPIDLKRFLDGVFRPRFDNEELFLFERQSIINEITNEQSTISNRQFQLVAENRFTADSPYRRSTMKEAENVSNFTLEDLARHHRQNFTKGNVVIFMAAHKPPRALFKELFKQFKSLDLPDGEHRQYPDHHYTGFKVAVYPKDEVAGQQYVSLSFPGLSYIDPVEERIALNLFCRVFTGLSRHSIFAPLRRSGIYAIDYHNIYYCYFGMVSFWATIPTGRTEEFLSVLSNSIEKFKTKPLSRYFLSSRLKSIRERTRNAWRNNYDLYNWLMEYILDEGNVRTPREVFSSLNKITPEFMQRLVGRIFDREKVNLVISGEAPKVDKHTLADWLKF